MKILYTSFGEKGTAVNRSILRLLIILFYFSAESTIAAESGFFTDHAQGWHWYENNDALEKNETQKTISSTAQIKQLRAEVEEKLNRAVLNPTQENVANYIRLQNQLSQQATRFSQAWESVLVSYPNLDYRLEHPTNQYAQQVYRDSQRQIDQLAIKDFAQNHGLFFFVNSSCPFCHAFAPTVKTVAERYGLSVLVISLDGQGIPEYPKVLPNNGIAERLDVRGVPALYAVDGDKEQARPLSYGLISAAELEEKIGELARNVQKEKTK